MTQAILGLGSNIGDKKQNIFIASDLISKLGTNFKISPLYETFPHGFEIQPNFVNAVCVLEVNFLYSSKVLILPSTLSNNAAFSTFS